MPSKPAQRKRTTFDNNAGGEIDMTIEKMKRAAIYARFSSDNQREESIDAQIRASEEFAKKQGMQIVKVYVDRAKTATTDKRPEFQKMIEDSGKGIFEILIIHKLDRFSRDKYDSARYKRKLKQNGIRLYSVTENLDGSPESVILESLLEGMAEYYSKNLAREVMKGMQENALKCQHTGGRPALGFDVDRATKKYIINEKEAEAVCMIFQLYLDGYGYHRIIDELNTKGYQTKLGKPFGKNSLHDILVNEKYCGTYVFNRSSSKDCDGQRNNHNSKDNEHVIRIPDGVPAIVSKDVFEKVQEKMKLNKRQPGAYKAKEVYLLSGLIVCGECLKRENREYSMMGNSMYSGRDKLKLVTYRCSNRERTKECDNKELRREYIENYVLSELEKNIFQEKAIPHLLEKINAYQSAVNQEKDKDLERFKLELDEVDKQMENIINAIVAGMNQTAFAGKINELEERKLKLEVLIKEINLKSQATVVTEEMLRGLFAMFRNFVTERDIPEIKKFIGNYVEKVIVYKDHVEVVFFLLCDNELKSESYHFRVKIPRNQLLEQRGKVA